MNSSLCNKKPTQNDEQLTEMYHDKLKHITPQRHVNTDRKQEYSSLQNNLIFSIGCHVVIYLFCWVSFNPKLAKRLICSVGQLGYAQTR